MYLRISRVWVAWCGAVAASRATFVLIPGKNCYQMEVNLLMQNTATCRYETIRTINSGLGTQFSQKPRIHWIADKYLQKCSPRLRANCEEGLSKFALQIVAKMSGLSGRKCVYYRAAEWVSHGQLPPAVHINSTHAQDPGSRQEANTTQVHAKLYWRFRLKFLVRNQDQQNAKIVKYFVHSLQYF